MSTREAVGDGDGAYLAAFSHPALLLRHASAPAPEHERPRVVWPPPRLAHGLLGGGVLLEPDGTGKHRVHDTCTK